MNNEPNKPIEAEELTEKELKGIVGGVPMPAERSAELKEIATAGCQLVVPSTGVAIAEIQRK